MPKKRLHGEGSIYPRGEYWTASILVDGRRLTKTSKNKKIVADWLKETRGQVEQGMTYSATTTTLEEFLLAWLARKEKELRGNTYEQYERIAHKHIIPAIGNVKFKSITPAMIQRLYDNMGNSERTIQIANVILHSVFDQAEGVGLVARNPTNRLHVPDSEDRVVSFWNESQVSQFIVSTRGQRYDNFYYMALVTGMRQGELRGLRWGDVNWNNKSLDVRQQVFHPRGGGYQFIQPKTQSGLRTIELDLELDNDMHRLQEQWDRVLDLHMQAGSYWQENDLVFPSDVGSPLRRWEITKDFKKMIDRAGMEHIRVHDLRHTAASLMLSNGTPPFIVSRRLGHSSIAITLDLYGHLIPESQREAARFMSSIVNPARVDRHEG